MAADFITARQYRCITWWHVFIIIYRDSILKRLFIKYATWCVRPVIHDALCAIWWGLIKYDLRLLIHYANRGNVIFSLWRQNVLHAIWYTWVAIGRESPFQHHSSICQHVHSSVIWAVVKSASFLMRCSSARAKFLIYGYNVMASDIRPP